jgi:hypothetical protein
VSIRIVNQSTVMRCDGENTREERSSANFQALKCPPKPKGAVFGKSFLALQLSGYGCWWLLIKGS